MQLAVCLFLITPNSRYFTYLIWRWRWRGRVRFSFSLGFNSIDSDNKDVPRPPVFQGVHIWDVFWIQAFLGAGRQSTLHYSHNKKGIVHFEAASTLWATKFSLGGGDASDIRHSLYSRKKVVGFHIRFFLSCSLFSRFLRPSFALSSQAEKNVGWKTEKLFPNQILHTDGCTEWVGSVSFLGRFGKLLDSEGVKTWTVPTSQLLSGRD